MSAALELEETVAESDSKVTMIDSEGSFTFRVMRLPAPPRGMFGDYLAEIMSAAKAAESRKK